MTRKLKPIPKLRSEDEEREFWATHDSTQYIDWSTARRVSFPDLKPSTEAISLRLPAGLLADVKVLANRMDVPYQSLIKVYLAERIERELRREGQPQDPATVVREPEAPYGVAPVGTHATPSRRRTRKPSG